MNFNYDDSMLIFVGLMVAFICIAFWIELLVGK